MSYRPKKPFITPMYYHTVTKTKINGVNTKVLDSGTLFYCSFVSYGGTEQDVNGVYSVLDTVDIETWFNPDIKSNCIIKDVNGKEYSILGVPENIDNRNQFLKFKIKAVVSDA